MPLPEDLQVNDRFAWGNAEWEVVNLTAPGAPVYGPDLHPRTGWDITLKRVR